MDDKKFKPGENDKKTALTIIPVLTKVIENTDDRLSKLNNTNTQDWQEKKILVANNRKYKEYLSIMEGVATDFHLKRNGRPITRADFEDAKQKTITLLQNLKNEQTRQKNHENSKDFKFGRTR